MSLEMLNVNPTKIITKIQVDLISEFIFDSNIKKENICSLG